MTDEFPLARLENGAWLFVHADMRIPLVGKPGEKDFFGHYALLRQHLNVDYVPTDPRSVYFLGWEGGPVKIGVAADPPARRAMLQIACPYELRIEALTTGGIYVEREYHAKFAARRLRAEWFERCPEIEAEIARLNSSSCAGEMVET